MAAEVRQVLRERADMVLCSASHIQRQPMLCVSDLRRRCAARQLLRLARMLLQQGLALCKVGALQRGKC